MPNPTVLEGAILGHINNGQVTTYKAGQSFSELPGDRHGVSANASKTKRPSSSRCSWWTQTRPN
jgi:quercetin dioxygenase-like cupin family protein